MGGFACECDVGVGEGDDDGWGLDRWCFAGGGVDADDPGDGEIWGGEFGCGEIVGDVGWGGAAKFYDFVAGARCGEFDAEEVGGEVAGVFDGVALEEAGAYAEGSGVCGWADDGGVGAVGFFVDDVDGAGVVEVDEDGWDVGVVMDGDVFVWSVVDLDDAEGLVGEDGGVVGREGLLDEEEEWEYAG